MTETQNTKEIPDQPPVISWQDFLQEEPPGSAVTVTSASKSSVQYGVTSYELAAPELQLHCPEPTCNALMFFTTKDGGDSISSESWRKTFLTYWCRNCRKYSKMFAVAVRLKDAKYCEVYKFGELPQFGPPLPARVLRLIQPDRELFLSGRRCENQGLGIGAFTYYRRVVENQWTRLVDEIIKVAKTVGTQTDILDRLAISRDEQQFSKAVKNLKDTIPPVLLINGQNPLVLLHGALSQGVHNLPDEECLNLAMSIRVVLVELAEKLGQALKDEKELTEAVSRLLRAQSVKKTKDESAKE
jgi:hypothetical protein